MEVPFTGGTRSVKRPYHQQLAQESTAPFVVSGVHALLFDDDTLAAFINSPAALLPWNGDQSLLIDRYDVRHLLQDLSGIRKRRPAPPLIDCTEEELNHERFRDLQDALSILPVEEQRASEDLSNPSAGCFQAVPFSYSEEATENGTQTGSTHRSMGFRPPFPVPDFLLPKLLEDRFADDIFVCGGQPSSDKLHQIMVGTAKFVKEHGGQSEILLKVKQGSNPMFGFLNVDHHLHDYYRFLVEHPELLQPVSQNNSRLEEATHSTGEGLSLLGFAYGSGDEDDDKALRLESTRGGTSGAVLPSREEVVASNGGGPSVEKAGGIAAQGKAFAATLHSPKMGEESQPKVNESAPRALSLLNKKKKSLIGTKEFIQPNKKIVSQLMANEAPRKEATDAIIRLPRKSESKTSSWHSVPSSKDLDYGMSADAAAAVVLAATRGARGLKQDSSNNNKSSSSSGLSQKALEANRQPSAVGVSKGTSLLGLGQTDVRLAKAVAEAAAIAASHEADSADALLTPAEKLKAERLRKAKMFAAMIKSGKCVSESGEKPAGQLLPAVTSTKSDDVRTDSFPGLAVNGKAVSNGRAISIEESPQIEEVEDSDINKSVHAGITDLMNKRSLKERVYRKRESKDQHKSKGQRSDSEESEHRRKRKSRHDHGVDKKQRHGKRKKHRAYDSESADSGCSSGNESKDQRSSSKSQRHRHHRRKRSHHEKDESRDGKARQGRHKVCNDDNLHSDLPDEKHRHRKIHERGASSSSEDEAPSNGKVDRNDKLLKAAFGEEERLPSMVPLKHSIVADNGMKTVITTEVPAEIRAKVRAMLLSTL